MPATLRLPLLAMPLAVLFLPGARADTPSPTPDSGPGEAAKRMLEAALLGDLDAVRKAVEEGFDVDASVGHGLTALQVARVRGHADVARWLAEKGADASREMPAPESFVDAFLAERAAGDSPAVVVLVRRDGKTLLEKAYGFADVTRKVPATLRTKFRIGSVTKQFTAAAILKLAEEGKLGVGDPLSRFFPDFPRAGEVTLRHLLHHTSGIHSYTEKPGFIGKVAEPVEPEALIASFRDDPYDFAPGKGWRYNNSGYFLLGRIVEIASGRTYEEYLRSRFFEPLGMKDTGVHRRGLDLEDEAMGHSWEDGAAKRALDWDMSWAGGAGALYSTVGDLARWNDAVFGGKVLGEASLRAALTPVALEEGTAAAPYGFGWVIGELRGQKEIAHGGGLNGFASHLAYYPDMKVTVAVLGNCDPPKPEIAPGAVAQPLAEAFLWTELAPREPRVVDASVSPEAYDALAGEYDYGSGILTVTREGDRLHAQMTGQPRFEIFPKSRTEFFWKVVEARIEFIKDGDGKVASAVHHQGGVRIPVKKLEGRKAAEIDPKVLDAIAGKYDYGGGAVLTVTREKDGLYAQLTGQPKQRILPSSETEFFWKDVNARVRFVKGSNGEVLKAVHQQGGRTFDAPRMD